MPNPNPAPSDAKQIAEHDRIYPPRRSDETAFEFLRRSVIEHRKSHESWLEPLRKNPEMATEATYGLAYQIRAVERYDEMLAALDEMSGRDVKPPRVGTFPITSDGRIV